MPDNIANSADVCEATREDLSLILEWLKREYDEDDDSGFWCNRGVIRAAFKKPGHLWVVRRNGKAVAFQVGEYAADIVSVRKDHRNCGLATSLLEASIQRATIADVNVLSVQCAPEASLGFWKRMGFEQYHHPRQPSDLMARRVLPRSFALPSNSSPVTVLITFYPEAALYDRDQSIPPISEHYVTGVHDLDGSIMLERRVTGLCDDEPEGRDLAIKIEVDGVERYFCKAKRDDAKNVGVLRDEIGATFFIDRIKAKEGGD